MAFKIVKLVESTDHNDHPTKKAIGEYRTGDGKGFLATHDVALKMAGRLNRAEKDLSMIWEIEEIRGK